jgi:hypothetical protein
LPFLALTLTLSQKEREIDEKVLKGNLLLSSFP